MAARKCRELPTGKKRMDPVNDPIDPAWWAPAFDDTTLEEYEAPELLSSHLERLAGQPNLDEFQQTVLRVLAMVTSAMLNPQDWGSPYSPAVEFGGGKRTLVPSDLTAEQVAVLAGLPRLASGRTYGRGLRMWRGRTVIGRTSGCWMPRSTPTGLHL